MSGGAGLVLRGGVAGEVALDLIVLWGAAVVIFLSGVRGGAVVPHAGRLALVLVLPMGWALWLLATGHL